VAGVIEATDKVTVPDEELPPTTLIPVVPVAPARAVTEEEVELR
jgi:hypothetical protein